MKLKDFSVGQTVYVKPVWNEARRNSNPRTGIVTKVGRRYVTVKVENFSDEVMFDSENEFCQKTEYAVDFVLFAKEQALLDSIEKSALIKELSTFINGRFVSNLTIDQLRAIKKIIDDN